MASPDSRIDVAVIGAGWWANEAHLPALLANPRARIRVVHSRSIEKAKRSAKRFGCADFTDSAEEALARPGLHAAVIASTPNAHRDQVVTALRCGLHVLVEKPLTLSLADARTIEVEAHQRHRHVIVSCPWQFTEHARRLRRKLALRGTGPLRSGTLHMTNWIRHLADPRFRGHLPSHRNYAEKPDPESYSDPSVCGGGFSFNQLSHALAWLFSVAEGDAPTGVSAQLENAGAPVDLFASFLIRLKRGGIVTVSGVGTPPRDHRVFEVRLYCEKAGAALELWQGEARWFPNTGKGERWADLGRAERYPKYAPVNTLVSLALGRGTNPSPLQPSVHAVGVIEAALRSAEAGGAWIPIP